ncbi:unnamed protein product [Schistosoma margrebowiei]|uniref:Uncharacterized protein n=1 Tax=Schistosoma margrebowiei TaxID=48269 RepID=A0AA84ZSI7_9TREM|nr:unnamed protein product [Schistosoma margrebowiei]
MKLQNLNKTREPYIKYFICKILINRLRLHYSFVFTSITVCSRSLLFNLLNLLPPGISLSFDDTCYLYLWASVVAHTTPVQTEVYFIINYEFENKNAILI